MNEKDMIEIERKKEKITDKYREDLSKLYVKEIKKAIKWFKKKFPKRTIKWYSGMGTNFWELDGEILHWSLMEYRYVPEKIVDYGDGVKHRFGGDFVWKETEPDRRARVLTPLWNIYQSINDVTNVLGPDIDTGNIGMEDV